MINYIKNIYHIILFMQTSLYNGPTGAAVFIPQGNPLVAGPINTTSTSKILLMGQYEFVSDGVNYQIAKSIGRGITGTPSNYYINLANGYVFWCHGRRINREFCRYIEYEHQFSTTSDKDSATIKIVPV